MELATKRALNMKTAAKTKGKKRAKARGTAEASEIPALIATLRTAMAKEAKSRGKPKTNFRIEARNDSSASPGVLKNKHTRPKLKIYNG